MIGFGDRSGWTTEEDTNDLGFEPPLSTSDDPEVVAGRYELIAEIGSGGFGTVYEALDRMTQARVALKKVAVFSASQRRTVRRELCALRWLKVPGVVRLLDDGQEGDCTFLVMPLIRGMPFLDFEGVAEWAEIKAAVCAFLEVLARVHLAGVVHRDLKPGNILVSEEGAPVLLDFGIAAGRALTRDERVAGSMRYMAPEQLRGEPLDARADLFAFGVMLFIALSGQEPWEGSVRRRLSKRAAAPPPLASVAPGVPAEVAEVVDRLLAFEREARPASALEVLEALGGQPPGVLVGELLPGLSGDRPATEEELRELFRGPDHFLHLREDAARLLMAESGGSPREVTETLRRWINQGRAFWEGGLVVIDRLAIEQISVGVLEPVVGMAVDLRDPWLLSRLAIGITEAALGQESPQARDWALYELERLPDVEESIEAMRVLLKAQREAVSGQGGRALELLRSVGPFADIDLEIWRQGLRARSTGHLARVEEEALIAELDQWADEMPSERRAKVDGWLGNLRYRQGRYEEAARLHERATSGKLARNSQISSMVNAGYSWLEAGRFDLAERIAERAVRSSAELRLSAFEARATALIRAARYRSKSIGQPDITLVEAAFHLGPFIGALVSLTEAAAAWRANSPAASELALRSAKGWREAGQEGLGVLLTSLARAAGAQGQPESDRRLADSAMAGLPVDLALQVLGLLCIGGARRDPRIDDLATRVMSTDFEQRLDILSVNEALCAGRSNISTEPVRERGASHA